MVAPRSFGGLVALSELIALCTVGLLPPRCFFFFFHRAAVDRFCRDTRAVNTTPSGNVRIVSI